MGTQETASILPYEIVPIPAKGLRLSDMGLLFVRQTSAADVAQWFYDHFGDWPATVFEWKSPILTRWYVAPEIEFAQGGKVVHR